MQQLINSIPDFEDKKTLELFKYFADLNTRDFLNKDDLLKILKWKSPRPLKHYEANNETEIQEITKLAFSAENDILKIHILTALKGVNYPAASAILMFRNPQKFPVLDIRVWQQLHKAKLVKTNQYGQGFTLKECEQYFEIIRKIATDLNLTARQVEKRLFDYDRRVQEGRLYDRKKPSR